MQTGKVRIADGTPETLDNLKLFLIESKRRYPEAELKTLASAIDFAIEQARKIPSLEKEILNLRADNFALQKDNGLLIEEVKKLKTRNEK